MKNAKKHLKGLLKFLFASAWGAGLSVSVLTLYHQTYQPTSSMDASALEQRLLLAMEEGRLAREQKLNQLADALTDLDTLLETQQDHIVALQTQNQEHSDRLSHIELQRHGIDKNALDRLEQRLNKVDKQLSQLGQRSYTPVKTTQTKPKPKVKPAITPPFTLFDVQKRGVSYIAVVGKADAKRLSELNVLRSGGRYLGWQLVSVHPTHVVVRHKGEEVTLEVEA